MKRKNDDLWNDMIKQNTGGSTCKTVSGEIEKKLNDSLKKMQDKIDEKLNKLGGNEDEQTDTEETSNEETNNNEEGQGAEHTGDNESDADEGEQ